MRKISLFLSIFLLVAYVASLTVIAVGAFGFLGLLAIALFIPLTIYQIVTHLLVGDIGELFIIVAWLGSILLLYMYSKGGTQNEH